MKCTGQLKVGKPVDVELGGRLNRVDGRQGDEHRQAHQKVVR